MDDLGTLLHRIQEEAGIRVEALESILGLIRRLSLQHGIGGIGAHLEPEDVSFAFFAECKERFGPLASDVLTDWKVGTPTDLGKAIGALADTGLLVWGEDDSPNAYEKLPPLPQSWPHPLDSPPFRESCHWEPLP